MDEAKHKPVFNRRIFWDVNFDTLDYDKRARFVFERGDVDDIRQCRRYYGDEKIREILTTAKWLSKKKCTWHVQFLIMIYPITNVTT